MSVRPEPFPLREEVKTALARTQPDKPAGPGDVSAERLNLSGDTILDFCI